MLVLIVCPPLYHIFNNLDAKFATTWEKSIVENFGKDGGLLLKMDNDAFLTLVADFNVTMSKSLSSIKTSKWKLSDFSGWLSSYDHSDQLSADVMKIVLICELNVFIGNGNTRTIYWFIKTYSRYTY